MVCRNCGQPLAEQATFCTNCGQKQGDPQQNSYQQQAPVYQTPQPVYNGSQAVKLKKKHGCLTALIVTVVILGLGVLAVYFLVPGLLKPYDLGIESSREAYEKAMDKIGISKDESPKTGEADDYEITYGPVQDVSTSLTSEEITSFINENRPDYYAVKDVQVRINDDGSIEASGKLDTAYVFEEVLNSEYSREDAKSALPMLGLLPQNVNVYVKASGSVSDNQLQGLSIESVSVMGIPIPSDLVSSQTAVSFVTSALNGYIERMTAKSGSSFDLIEADDGEVSIIGQVPSSIERIQEN